MEHKENARYAHLTVNTTKALDANRGWIMKAKDAEVDVCPCCGSKIQITFMKQKKDQLRYLCTNTTCLAMVPCYKGTDYPMGLMAAPETITARLYVKKNIERLNKFVPRPEIFDTIEKIVGRPHVAVENMTKQECDRVNVIFSKVQRNPH